MELHLTAPDMPPLAIPVDLPSGPTDVIVSLQLTGEGQEVGDEAASWFSRYLSTDCRLYHMKPSHLPRYFVNDPYYGSLGKPGEQASFSYRSSVMMLSQNALDDLNGRLETPVPMNRFRPNIVMRLPEEGASVGREYPEDKWTKLMVGSAELRLQRPCTRCPITTVDQELGVRKGPEPLRTLRTFRMYTGTNEVLVKHTTTPTFGTYYGVAQEGTIAVGDMVSIV